jgi:catechol-2,3-dioxygenase
MVKVNKVAHIVLTVRDVGASLKFYADTLGMEIVTHREDSKQGFLSFGDQHHDIAVFGAPEGAEQGSLGLHHVAFQIDGGIEELKEIHDALLTKGYVVDGLVDRGITQSIHLTDPDGNRLEIMAETMSGAEGREYLREGRPGNMPLSFDGVGVR